MVNLCSILIALGNAGSGWRKAIGIDRYMNVRECFLVRAPEVEFGLCSAQ